MSTRVRIVFPMAACVLASAPALAFCPSYTLSSSNNSHDCGVEAINGTNPTVAQWQDIFAVVAKGKAAWGSNGPSVGTIGQGCGNPEPLHSVAAKFPCELLKAIAMQESGWRQFCVPDSPADEVGGASRTIISFDCGYGVGQVTSGMHIGETPSFDRLRVAGDPLYNLATGASILAGKWKATNCVGDNQPTIIEDWYAATWAYNGLSYKNNPNNPNYDPARGVWNPKAGGGAPYQEHVFGWVEHPPDSAHWTAVKLAYPRLSDIGGASSPPTLPEPSCVSPTNCASSRAVHVSTCLADPPDAGTPDAGEPDSGTVVDAGVVDAGVSDAMDAGTPDAGEVDAGDPAAQDGGDPGSGGTVAGGCGCGATANLGSVLGGALVMLLFAARRRSSRPIQR